MKTHLKLSIAALVCLGSINVVTASNQGVHGLNDENTANPHVVIRMQAGTPTPEVDLNQQISNQPTTNAHSTATVPTLPSSSAIPVEEPSVEENNIKKYIEKYSRSGKKYHLWQTEIEKDANTPANKEGKYAGMSAPHWAKYQTKGEKATIDRVKWEDKINEQYYTLDLSNWEYKDFFDAYAGRNVDKGRLNTPTVEHLLATKQIGKLVGGALKNVSNDIQKLIQGNNAQNQ